MNEKNIVTTATFLASLFSYVYAREAEKDAVPYVMVGGFIGSIIGEVVAETVKKNRSDNQSNQDGNSNL